MSKRFARIDATDTVTKVYLVGDDVSNGSEYLQDLYKTTDQMVEINSASTHAETVQAGFTYTNNTFVETKPYSSWVADESNGVRVWVSPTPGPTKINNDQEPMDSAPSMSMALALFEWDDANVRWLNKLGQYWNNDSSTWVDV